MDYNQTIEYLYALQPPFHIVGAKAYKPGFENIHRLLEANGNPHLRLRTVHVAGTNGKGSTSHLIAAALQAAGFKTGLYTSPHLVDYTERIRIDGQMISQQYVTDFVRANQPLLEAIKPSFFETATAMAFSYFAAMEADIAVVEVGLGGRLDSTNVIEPEVSVITNIGIDHTQFLGTTLAQIASEKAGIIKQHTPVVIGEVNDETHQVFNQKATQMQAPIHYAANEVPMPPLECELKGDFQHLNIQTAYTTLMQLRNIGWSISDQAIKQGFAQVCTLTGLQGRWQTLATKPLTICDTGHNSHAYRHIAKQLKHIEGEQLYVVFGMVDDKDTDQVFQLLPTDAYYFFTQPKTKRALPADHLFQLATNYGLQGETEKDVILAYQHALQKANERDAIFIGGSNYVVGELLEWHKNCSK